MGEGALGAEGDDIAGKEDVVAMEDVGTLRGSDSKTFAVLALLFAVQLQHGLALLALLALGRRDAGFAFA
jgi:hypothetical protein